MWVKGAYSVLFRLPLGCRGGSTDGEVVVESGLGGEEDCDSWDAVPSDRRLSSALSLLGDAVGRGEEEDGEDWSSEESIVGGGWSRDYACWVLDALETREGRDGVCIGGDEVDTADHSRRRREARQRECKREEPREEESLNKNTRSLYRHTMRAHAASRHEKMGRGGWNWSWAAGGGRRGDEDGECCTRAGVRDEKEGRIYRPTSCAAFALPASAPANHARA